MTDHFPAEPGSKCEFCTEAATVKSRIMRKVKGKKPNARVATGFFIYSCARHLNTAKRQAGGGMAATR